MRITAAPSPQTSRRLLDWLALSVVLLLAMVGLLHVLKDAMPNRPQQRCSAVYAEACTIKDCK